MTKKLMKQMQPLGVKRSSLPLTISELMEDYIYRIDLDADYQREKVWSKSDQELLLDSIIKDIDIPKLYLAKVHSNKQFDFECIDGKQRLLTLSTFMDPDDEETDSLRVDVLNKKYTYEGLKRDHPTIAAALAEYTLDFVVYDESNLTESFIRDIFRRLQLGIRLKSGEILNSQLGTMRDFVFKEIGKDGPFLRHTKLSDKRFSRPFTLAQICINSFHRARHGEFVRARLNDLEEFFLAEASLSKTDEHLTRIRKVLHSMDEHFGTTAQNISSRAVAVSAYLFVESLVIDRRAKLIPQFVTFYAQLLEDIREDMERASTYQRPQKPDVLDGFQKYVLQASVEPYAIKRRHEFLTRAFQKYSKKTNKRRPK